MCTISLLDQLAVKNKIPIFPQTKSIYKFKIVIYQFILADHICKDVCKNILLDILFSVFHIIYNPQLRTVCNATNAN